ncbi:MAG: hypothetical protein ABL897_11335 [Hyphomicrobium sp.]
MRPDSFERVDILSEPEVFPLRSIQGAATAPSLLHLALLSGLAAVVVLPQLGLAGYALASPDVRQLIVGQPLVAFQLAAAMLFWVGLFAWPLRALFARLTWRRSVEITRENVAVFDRRTFGGSNWTAPLHDYKGVAHHIRSSLSGTRHELVLVHPDSDRSVLLMTAEHISEADISRMTRLLGLPAVPARELYWLASRGQSDAEKAMPWMPLAA